MTVCLSFCATAPRVIAGLGFWFVLDEEFQMRVLESILDLCEESSWDFQAVPSAEAADILSELVRGSALRPFCLITHMHTAVCTTYYTPRVTRAFQFAQGGRGI